MQCYHLPCPPLTPYPTTSPSVPSPLQSPRSPPPLPGKISGNTLRTPELYYYICTSSSPWKSSTRQWRFRSFPPTRLLGSWGWTCPVGNRWMKGGLPSLGVYICIDECAPLLSLFPIFAPIIRLLFLPVDRDGFDIYRN